MVRRFVWCLAVAAACGCGPDATPRKPTAPTAPKPSVRREPTAWANFEKELEPVLKQPFPLPKRGHPGGRTAMLYASPWAKDALRKLMADPAKSPGEFRVGSLLVQKQDDGALYIMRKLPASRMSPFKGWYFALDRSGRVLIETGGTDSRAKEACVDCHSTLGARTDWVIPPRKPK